MSAQRTRGWLSYLTAFGISTIPFVLYAGRLVQDSLSDVPEAYLVWIPLVSYFWIGWQLQRTPETERSYRVAPWFLGLVAAVGLLLGLTLGGMAPTRFNDSALLLWPVWTAMVMWVLYGLPTLAQIWRPLLYLYLVWPPIYIWIIDRLNPHLEAAAYHILNGFSHAVPWLHVLAAPGTYAVDYAGKPILVGVTAACSGSDSILALLVLFPVALLVFEMTWRRKLLMVAAGCGLAFIANILRIMVIFFVAHHWGPYWAFTIVHPLIGPLLFVVLVLLLLSYGGIKPAAASWGVRTVAARRAYMALGASAVFAVVLPLVLNPFGR